MIRVNHYGMDATIGAVQNSLAALGAALTEQGCRWIWRARGPP